MKAILFLTAAAVALYAGPPSARGRYVAMGSSFGAGPGVGTRAADSPIPCMVSAENYAHLLAGMRNLDLTDVTCSGATTASILESWRGHSPQLDAVGPGTKLVTITIGGNDVFYIGNLYAWSCENAPQRFSEPVRPFMCKPTPGAQVEAAFSGLDGNLRKVVAGIHERSPSAKIVFVDYATVLPPSGSCRDRLPVTADELDRGRAVAARLAAVTAKAAEATGSLLLRASELTKAHDVCAADPWVVDLQFPTPLGAWGPVAYHPNEKAMRAIADELNRMLPAF